MRWTRGCTGGADSQPLPAKVRAGRRSDGRQAICTGPRAMRMRSLAFILVAAGALTTAGCGGEIDGGQSTARTEEGLSGCHGIASSSIPSSGDYYLTTFGASPSDDGTMSCGTKTLHGTWFYAASRQRYGCGSHVKIEANGKCVIAKTADYG